MPLRLFGGQGSGGIRPCPACEREIAADATFCPSCYMILRPDGAVDLREHLRGGRIPGDVYLLRKMQADDPNAGPVVRESPVVARPPSPAEALVQQVPAASSPESVDRCVSNPSVASAPLPSTPTISAASPETAIVTPVESRRVQTAAEPEARAWKGVQSLLRFDPPLPPPTHSAEGVSALLTWMLERDPVIPNNLDLLDTLHAGIFQDGPALHLGYRQHLLVQIDDDLLLHPAQEALEMHLGFLATAYRKAASTYHTAHKREGEKNTALWQMASMASRLRVEAWVFRTRYGVTPSTTRPRRSRTSRVSAD
jgi:hypothetical protein